MAVTGISSAYGNVYESRYASSKKEVSGKQEAEQAAGEKYANAQEYYDYLKGKYGCLSMPWTAADIFMFQWRYIY